MVRLQPGTAEQIRKRIEERLPKPGESAAARLDLPLSQDLKRALEHAQEESAVLGHSSIDCDHLLLGLLRSETAPATAILRELGVTYEDYRESMVSREPAAAAPGPLGQAAADLRRLVATVTELQDNGGPRLKRTGWTRKEALGHLIDWAAAHQQWIARALAEPKLTAAGFPEESWLAAQQYATMRWQDLVELCAALNRLIAHVIDGIPSGKPNTPCRFSVAEPIPLQELVQRYVAHCEDILGQLLTRG